jgi:exodeoxyribonuclease V alpha subunit
MRPTASIRPLLPAGTQGLEPFVSAGILAEAEVQVAGAVARSVPAAEDAVLLAAALCVRALQLGHVCVVIDEVADTIVAEARGDASASRHDLPPVATDDLPWPEPSDWARALMASDAVTVRDPASAEAGAHAGDEDTRPLVFDGARIYLERYWRYERQVGDLLLDRAIAPSDAPVDGPPTAGALDPTVEVVLDRHFGPERIEAPDLQRRAARTALSGRLTVIAGGPGTGKTHTVARLLASLHQLAVHDGRPLQVALAAPTGKAAARMTEAVARAAVHADGSTGSPEVLPHGEASTIHRLLGYRDGISFRHDRANPLPHDVVVVDEVSMVAMPLMARLLDALRPDARLVLVGDPHQLASVEAGAVLGDIVGPSANGDGTGRGPLADRTVVLRQVHRFAADSGIAELADAVRSGDSDRAIEALEDPTSDEVRWIDPSDGDALRQLRDTVVARAGEVARAARDGEALGALDRAGDLKVLCATRFGPLGAFAWRDHLERRLPALVPGLEVTRGYYVGRPVIVTRNDYVAGVMNGDTGVVVRADGHAVVAMPGPDGVRMIAPSQLDEVETWWAMTIHKSQGSEFSHAVVSLPDEHSRVLTRELLYTGITRGREQVTVVSSEAALRAAIARPVSRASGLRARLWSEEQAASSPHR